MANFRAVIQGQRGEASRLGSKKSGIQASVDGWGSGVDVRGRHIEGEGDAFNITVTGGSGYGSSDRLHLGEVLAGQFLPSDQLKRLVIEEYKANNPTVGVHP